jgi:hypothetical protein
MTSSPFLKRESAQPQKGKNIDQIVCYMAAPLALNPEGPLRVREQFKNIPEKAR